MMSIYNLKVEELGKMPQRIYSELLSQIPSVITYQQTGEIIDVEGKRRKDLENLEWARKEGMVS